MERSKFRPGTIAWIVGIAAVILFVCSSTRHALFYSGLDLSWFDQASYLISRGKPPIVSFAGYHILGDHAAFIFYLLAIPYKLFPSVHWLFAIQAIALAAGAIPAWHLAIQAGLSPSLGRAIVWFYILHPLVFNVNLFDFHPETIAAPVLLLAIWAARSNRFLYFCAAIAVVLSCKAVLSLTVAALGIWLLACERRRWMGAVALSAGVLWFLLATQVIIPHFSGSEAAAVGRYAYLGDSVFGIVRTLFLKPWTIFAKILAFDNFFYLFLLALPMWWALTLSGLAPLIGAIPTLALNILADYQPQKDLFHQYSLPALPFLIVSAIATLAAGRSRLRGTRAILIWSLICFAALAKYGLFWSVYADSLPWQGAAQEAISRVAPQASLLTRQHIAPHVSHRVNLRLTSEALDALNLSEIEYVLLHFNQPGCKKCPILLENLQADPNVRLDYQKDDVYLFKREPEN